MHKLKVEIRTDKGVLKAGEVTDISKHLKAKEVKELEDAGYIEKYTKPVEKNETNKELETLKASNEELASKVKELEVAGSKKDEEISSLKASNEELASKVKELEDTTAKTPAAKTGAKK